MDAESDLERLQKAAEELGEHFDSVQIFASRHEGGEQGGTVHVNWGVGNWFARFGQVREWLVKTEERTRDGVRHETD